MPKFNLRALVTVYVEMEIEASSPEEAREIFDNKVIMTAGMVDIHDDQFCVCEDSISDISIAFVEKIK